MSLPDKGASTPVADPPGSGREVADEGRLDQEFATLLEAGGLDLGELGISTPPTAEVPEATPEPAPEPPAAAEGEPIPPDAAPSPEPSLETEPSEEVPPAIEKMQKRINQVTARAKAAETLVEELRAKLELTGKPQPPEEAPPAAALSDPAETSPDVREARKAESKAVAERTRARELRAGLSTNAEAVIEEMKGLGVNLPNWEPEYVSRFLDAVADNAGDRIASERTKAELAIARSRDSREYQRAQVSALAEQRFPALKDVMSPLYLASQSIIQARPWLRDDPYGTLFAAICADYLARQKPPGTPRPPPKPSNGRPTVLPGGVPARAQLPIPSGEERRASAWNKVQKPGDDAALEAAIAEEIG